MATQSARLNATNSELDAKQIITNEDKMSRVLHLTNNQFDALYDILAATVEYIEGDLITTEDENGNEILENIEEYEAYQIFQLIKNIRGKSNA